MPMIAIDLISHEEPDTSLAIRCDQKDMWLDDLFEACNAASLRASSEWEVSVVSAVRIHPYKPCGIWPSVLMQAAEYRDRH